MFACFGNEIRECCQRNELTRGEKIAVVGHAEQRRREPSWVVRHGPVRAPICMCLLSRTYILIVRWQIHTSTLAFSHDCYHLSTHEPGERLIFNLLLRRNMTTCKTPELCPSTNFRGILRHASAGTDSEANRRRRRRAIDL